MGVESALAPVFMLVAIGNILNILSTRLGRIVDRVRALQDRHGETDGAAHDLVVSQMRALDQRIHLNNGAHLALVMAGLAIGMTVGILFVGELIGHPLEQVAAGCFLIAIALMMWGLTLFLRETRVAANTLRIPPEMLEHHRDIEGAPARRARRRWRRHEASGDD